MSKVEINSFFCEDFRKEVDGRCSAIGIFSVVGQMYSFPHEVDRLSLVTYVSVPRELDACSVSIRIEKRGVESDSPLKEFLREDIPRGDVEENHPFWQIVSEYSFGQLKFERNSYLHAIVEANGVQSVVTLNYVDAPETGIETELSRDENLNVP